MGKIHYIYGLYSTRKLCETGLAKVKYIGRTSNTKSRLNQHLRSVGKTNNILYQWMSYELGKGYEIKLTILDQCYSNEVNELEKKWIESESRKRKLLNTTSNDKNSVHHLHKEIKRLRYELLNQSIAMNELTGVKNSKKIINELHLLDQTRKLNIELSSKVILLEKYIQNDLKQPLPYSKRKPRKPKKELEDTSK